jgi:hypothetical protein
MSDVNMVEQTALVASDVRIDEFFFFFCLIC